MSRRTPHTFSAIAYEQNFSLKEIAKLFPEGKATALDLSIPIGKDAHLFFYPFGAVAFHNIPPDQREPHVAKLQQAYPGLTLKVVREELTVTENPDDDSGMHDGTLGIRQMTPGRAGVIALTVAQSAAMEYYEQIVDSLHLRTSVLVERLEKKGSVAINTRPLHRFIGEAISVRSEVLGVLHLLDKPDATWDDTAMDAIYQELKDEFDLVDRYEALESKLRSVQEALELILGVARDFRLVVLEASIVVLIVFEIVLSFVRGH
jgi:uncharacterized Rmd1/YagE family protein